MKNNLLLFLVCLLTSLTAGPCPAQAQEEPPAVVTAASQEAGMERDTESAKSAAKKPLRAGECLKINGYCNMNGS